MPDRISVQIDVPDELLASPVPSLALATLVENAVKHGIAPKLIHRSAIVDANGIPGVSRDLRGRMAVRLKSRPGKLPVSETHERRFRQM